MEYVNSPTVSGFCDDASFRISMFPVLTGGQASPGLGNRATEATAKASQPGAFDISLPFVLRTYLNYLFSEDKPFSFFSDSWNQLHNTHHLHFTRRKFRFREKLIAQGPIDSRGHS